MTVLPRQFLGISWLLPLMVVANPLAMAKNPAEAEAVQPAFLGPQAGPEATDAGWNLRQDLTHFRNHAPEMEPHTAATQWLQLLDRAVELSHHPERAAASLPVYIQEVYLAVPPPEAWDALETAIRARPVPAASPGVLPAQALRVLAARLTGHTTEMREAVEMMAAAATGAAKAGDKKVKAGGGLLPPDPDEIIKEVGLLREAVFKGADTRETAAEFEARLRALAPAGTGPLQSLTAPDLVKEVGTERAEAILREALVAPQPIQFGYEAATKDLARRLAWEMKDRLTFVPWDLMQTLDSWRFFLQMQERLPNAGSHEPPTMDQEEATGYAILGAAIAGESDASRRLLKELAQAAAAHGGKLYSSFGPYIWRDAVDAGGAEACWAVFDWLARAEPAICDWEAYEYAALRTSHLEPAIAMMKETIQGHSLDGKTDRRFRGALADALLAADHGEEAILLLRDEALAEPGLNIESRVMDEIRKAGKAFDRLSEEKQKKFLLLMLLGKTLDAAMSADTIGPAEHLQHLGRVANLARWWGESEVCDQALQAMLAGKDLLEEADFDFEHKFGLGLIPLFVEAGRGWELEQRLKRWLAASAKEDATKQTELDAALINIRGARSWRPALRLVEFCAATGRDREIVDMFDQGRFWPVDDLAGVLIHLQRENPEDDPESFGPTAARALAFAGRPDPALATLHVALETDGASDVAYESLLQLLPSSLATARLDELSALQPLDARPLIWKARLLLRQVRPDEAERCAGRALLVIPFDADRSGDRAQAWDVLAQALSGRNDLEAASAHRRAEALRLLPQALEFEEAGLFTRALARCQDAHEMFGEDFGIEWKRGLLLRMLARTTEARQAFEKAVELMPAALGRYNQRWLDDGELLDVPGMRAVAERRWKNLGLNDDEQNPRSHYALAKLRWSQDRKEDCRRELERAVALDPDFYDAWHDLREEGEADAAGRRSEWEANEMRLNPRGKYGSTAEPWDGSDCRRVWAGVAEAARHDPAPPVGLYPFRASQLARRQRDPAQRTAAPTPALRQERVAAAMDKEWQYGKLRFGRLFSPAAKVMSDPVIAMTSQFLGMAPPYNGPEFRRNVDEFSPVNTGGDAQ